MPVVYMTAALGILVFCQRASSLFEKFSIPPRPARALAACSCLFIIAPAATTLRSLPHPGLYVNALGGGRTGYFFPHDEFYDLGARESIQYIAEHAPAAAMVASEIPGVMRYYLQRYSRQDIKIEIISRPGGDPRLVLLQSGRVYFENRADVDAIRRRFRAVQSSSYAGTVASEVFDLGEIRQAQAIPHPSSDRKNQ
jgi:hypothetical protein